MGMYTTHVDPSEIKKKFGIEIDGWEQIELVERSKKVPAEEAESFYAWMEQEFGGITAKKEAVLAQIKMYLVLKQMIAEKHYDFVAVKCLPELTVYHTTFCLAHALLNDKSDAFGEKESFVCACEADLNGALTMQMMKNVSGGAGAVYRSADLRRGRKHDHPVQLRFTAHRFCAHEKRCMLGS